MGRYSAAMKAEEASASRQSRWLLSLATSPVMRYSFGPVPAPGVGNFLGRILDVSTFTRSSADRNNSLAPAEMSVMLDDTDGTLIRAARGATGGTFRGTAVTLSRGSVNPAISSSDWLPAFVGVIDQYEVPEIMKFVLRARSDDRRLARSVPVNITRADWPNASKEAIGQIAPRIYGTHDSVLTGGAAPLLLADQNRFQYIVALGFIAGVDRVYSAGIQLSSGWTASYVTINGRRWTIVTFTTDQSANAITADVRGYAANADGTGAVISNQADQLRHFITNWHYGDYRAQAAWLSDSLGPVDTTLFATAATFLSDRGYSGSRWIGGASDRTGVAVLNEWTAPGSVGAKTFWTGAGKLAIRFWDHGLANASTLIDSPRAIGRRDTAGISVRYDSLDLLSTAKVQFVRNEARDAYTQSLNVRDPTVVSAGAGNIDQPWSYAGG